MEKSDKEYESQWMKGQIEKYNYVFKRYKKYSEFIERVLKKAVKKYAPEAIVQVRPKSVCSFAEKIKRKPTPLKNPVNEFTDLCGGRVITASPSEVKAMCKFVEDHFNIDWGNSNDLSKRHKPAEFGYRSIHYIITFRKGVFPTEDVDISIDDDLFPDENCPLKAEIQIRTFLEHAWAVFSHDRTYKSSFAIPKKWERELATVAAVLENADNDFDRIQKGLRTYASSYNVYMTDEQIRDKIKEFELILKYVKENTENIANDAALGLATRIGQLALSIGDFQKVVDTLSSFIDLKSQPALKTLGVAMCKMYRNTSESENYKSGQRYLESAIELEKNDADAVASLAGTWKRLDEDKAAELYRQAFEIDSSDPYPLENYLTYEIVKRKDISIVSIMTPFIQSSIKRCREQIAVGVNIPWAYYSMGIFYLLLKKPFESLSAYAKAVQISTAGFMIETSLASLRKLSVVEESLPGYEWVRRLHILGSAAKFPNTDIAKEIESLKSKGHDRIQDPVMIVAGGCDPSIEEAMCGYRAMLIEAFRGFRGTIISGGTTQGISGLVGDLREKYPESIRTIGYVPKMIPSDAIVEKNPVRYEQIRFTDGSGFTPLEPLQKWVDLISSGIKTSNVRVLGINGGSVASVEYKVALALGAEVALIAESGREASKLLTDEDWINSPGLISMPTDPQTVRAFIGSGQPKMDSYVRETMAKAFHEHYREMHKNDVLSKEPSCAQWNELPDNLKESNLQEADHTFEKLRQIRCEVYEVKDKKISLIDFSEQEIEIMAEMEHGRWNAERLLDGWRWGEKKDVGKKISPYLVSWNQLPENVREWDRNMVRKIPEILANVGIEIRRINDKTSR